MPLRILSQSSLWKEGSTIVEFALTFVARVGAHRGRWQALLLLLPGEGADSGPHSSEPSLATISGLQPDNRPRSSFGIEPGLDDAMGPRREFARRFTEGTGKLAGSTSGDHRKKIG
ncbi:hypothetical protein GW17_00024068 [Ensete ventricosum]|nr:hypothetical protein GW17_00024068 [Ensete ventricosum]